MTSLPPKFEWPVVLRDFNSSHPDFEFRRILAFADRLDLGIVHHEIDIRDGDLPVEQRDPNNRKPKYVGGLPVEQGGRPVEQRSTNGADHFADWYNDRPADSNGPAINKRFDTFLQLQLDSEKGTYKFGEDPDGRIWGEHPGLLRREKGPKRGKFLGFFPLDTNSDPQFAERLPGLEGRHNFHFTLELHQTFVYRGGEVFTFIGDDDLWVFIDGKLVVDLGGVHVKHPATIALDNLMWLHPDGHRRIELEVGKEYPFDVFYAERHTKESNFFMETSILLKPSVQIHALKDAVEPQSWQPAVNGEFEIKLDKPSIEDLQIPYAVGGSAAREFYELRYEDGRPLGDAIALPADTESLKILVVPTNADPDFDDDTVEIQLLKGKFYEVGTKDRDQIVIADYIPPTVSIHATQNAVEPQSWRPAVNGEFTIRLDKTAEEDLTVGVKVAGSANPAFYTLQFEDGSPVGDSVVLAKGRDTFKIVVIPQTDNNFVDDTVELTLLEAAQDQYILGKAKDTVIIADYVPPIAKIEPTQNAVEPDPGEAIAATHKGLFTIYLTEAAPEPLTVNLTVVPQAGDAEEGVDYEPLPRSVTFAKGEKTATLPVIPKPDPADARVHEGPEDVTVALQPGEGYRLPELETARSATIQIVDREVPQPPVVTIEATRNALEPKPGEAIAEPHIGLFTVRLEGDPQLDKTVVQFTVVAQSGDAQEGIDYETLPRQVEINRGDKTATIQVIAKADPASARVFEGPENVTLKLQAGEGYRLPEIEASQSATIQILDEAIPVPTATIEAVRNAKEPKPGEAIADVHKGLFMIRLDGEPLSEKTVIHFSVEALPGHAQEGVDYEPLPRSVEINSGDRSALVTVIAKADPANAPVFEGPENVMLKLQPATGYQLPPGAAGRSATIQIVDEQLPPIAIIEPHRHAHEPAPGALATADHHGLFVVRLEGEPKTDKTVIHYTVIAHPTHAQEGVDYEPLARMVEIGRHEKMAFISVVPKADPVNAPHHEGPEMVQPVLQPGSDYRVSDGGTGHTAVIYIFDKPIVPPPKPVVEIEATDNEAYEPNKPGEQASGRRETGEFTISVVKDHGDKDLVIRYGIRGSADPNQDYILLAQNGSKLTHRSAGNAITIPRGQRSIKVTVVPIGDLDFRNQDRRETVVMSLDPVADSADYKLGRKRVDTVTIYDPMGADPH